MKKLFLAGAVALFAFATVPSLALPPNVVRLQQTDGSFVQIQSPAGTVIESAKLNELLLPIPSGVAFPEGLLSIEVSGGPVGGTIPIQITYETPILGAPYSNFYVETTTGYTPFLPAPAVADDGTSVTITLMLNDDFGVPLSITSTLAEDSVSETAPQTLTFTFGEDVTGFDLSDIVLSNVTPGTFTTVSANVYKLDVTGIGGKVTASVPANAAASVATGLSTVGDTFSNFYQDTWTLDLPGSVPMELIRIPAGTFTMGSPSGELSRNFDEAEHQVTLTQDFYLGKTEVTQQQWLVIRGSWPGTAPSSTFGVGNNFPAYNVSHDDVQTFMSDLNTAITEPGTFSLPTESQWEYAARAGTTTRFNFGDGLHPSNDEGCGTTSERTDNMWYCGNNSPNGTKAVGQKPANAWGVRDMHGNVWEWCADWYSTYPGTVTDPTGPESSSSRLYRGGSWADNAQGCRSAQRVSSAPATRVFSLGFRVCAVRPVSLAITSTLAENSVSQTAPQTLTFTFGEGVTGFDLSDIALTGATAGTFTPVSASVYTLNVTGTGGTVSASVAANAAAVPAPYTANQAATFSNFYQDTWTITLPGSVPMELIRIPAGTFMMGSPETELSRETLVVGLETQHTVTLTQDFYLGKTEVTQEQWLAISGSFPIGPISGQIHGSGAGSETRAVHRVSYVNIMDASTGFMKLLNDHVTEPGSFSLPTEAQWEYACRAGTTTRFNFGDGFASDETTDTAGGRGDNMWFSGNNSPSGTKLVGLKPANAWGLHDMHGNLREWCADWADFYPAGPVTDPTGPGEGASRIIRGGSWGIFAQYCRSAHREFSDVSIRNESVGFRVAAVR